MYDEPSGAGALPAPEGLDFLVVMGGPMNIYQHDAHPWLAGREAVHPGLHRRRQDGAGDLPGRTAGRRRAGRRGDPGAVRGDRLARGGADRGGAAAGGVRPLPRALHHPAVAWRHVLHPAGRRPRGFLRSHAQPGLLLRRRAGHRACSSTSRRPGRPWASWWRWPAPAATSAHDLLAPDVPFDACADLLFGLLDRMAMR